MNSNNANDNNCQYSSLNINNVTSDSIMLVDNNKKLTSINLENNVAKFMDGTGTFNTATVSTITYGDDDIIIGGGFSYDIKQTLRNFGLLDLNTNTYSGITNPLFDGNILSFAFDKNDSSIIYFVGDFSMCGEITAYGIVKWNGSVWSNMNSGLYGGISNTSIAIDSNNNIYIGGNQTFMKWDGSTWNTVGNGIQGTVRNIYIDVNDNVYVCGDISQFGFEVFTTYIAKWNGNSWESFGNGFDGVVSCVAVDSNGIVYAGGEFMNSQSTTVNHVAKWNGTSWDPMGYGIDGYVYSIAINSSDNVYVGGNFVSSDITFLNRIALWSGSEWTAVGNGFDGAVNDIKIYSDVIYVGGDFTMSNNVTIYNLAKWNGTSWVNVYEYVVGSIIKIALSQNKLCFCCSSNPNTFDITAAPLLHLAKLSSNSLSSISSGFNDLIKSIASDSDGNIYVGGLFTRHLGTTMNYIAKWNGTSWSAMGNGFDSFVNSIAIDSNNNIYAGGNFSTSGSTTVNRIARWNGSAWVAVGNGFDDAINTVTVDSNNTLYVGGIFTHSSSTTINRIAKWNGSSWTSMSNGFDSGVNSIAINSNNVVYAGGSFTHSGIVNIKYISYWNGTSWVAMANSFTSSVNTIAIDSNNNVYASSITSYPQTKICKWNGTSWDILGDIFDNEIYVLKCDSHNNLYAGGYFSYSGSSALNYLVKWNGSSWVNAYTYNFNSRVSCLLAKQSDVIISSGSSLGSISSFINNTTIKNNVTFSGNWTTAPVPANLTNCNCYVTKTTKNYNCNFIFNLSSSLLQASNDHIITIPLSMLLISGDSVSSIYAANADNEVYLPLMFNLNTLPNSLITKSYALYNSNSINIHFTPNQNNDNPSNILINLSFLFLIN